MNYRMQGINNPSHSRHFYHHYGLSDQLNQKTDSYFNRISHLRPGLSSYHLSFQFFDHSSVRFYKFNTQKAQKNYHITKKSSILP